MSKNQEENHNVSENDRSRLKWYCNEVISPAENDECISSLEFNREGDLLAYGNTEGQINIYKVDKSQKSSITKAKYSTLSVYGSLLSHEPEFDCLTSLEIKPKINYISWLPKFSQSNFLLSSNDLTIKLWKISQVPYYDVINLNFSYELGCRNEIILRCPEDLRVPRFHFERENLQMRCQMKSKFQRGHKFPITGLACLSDGENFVSCDSFNINLWNLNDQANVFAIRQNEVVLDASFITCMATSNYSPSTFAYGDSFGSLHVCDTRTNALCDKSLLNISGTPDVERFTIQKCLAYVSDIKFANNCDRFLYIRNFPQVHIYDLTMPDKPLKTFDIHPHLMSHLSNLFDYEIGGFDRFKISVSHDDKYISTGSYDSSFKIISTEDEESPIHDLSMKGFSGYNRFLKPEEEGKQPDEITVDKSRRGNGSPALDKKWLNTSFSPTDYSLIVGNRSYLHLLEGIPN